MNNFNRLAGIYDALAGLVFGHHIADAQKQFLHLIPDSSDILIVGGGTGWIIGEIKNKTANCRIWYIELSEKMLLYARARGQFDNVILIHGDESDIPDDVKFDVVITNFFLDVYPDCDLKNSLPKIQSCLKPEAMWFVADFVSKTWWHNVFLWTMYRFFRLTTNINAAKLPQWESHIEKLGYAEIKYRFYYGSFIKSVVYKKSHFF